MTARGGPKKGTWSRTPGCPWRVVAEAGGDARCSYASLKSYTAALSIAEFTLFDQRYVEGAIRGLRENYRGPFADYCAPGDCPRLVQRLVNRIRA